MAALDDYLDFILNYAPYFYYIPGSGVDTETGRGVAAAAFAIDFLCEAYSSGKFPTKQTDIYNKIVSLADWILTQQCTDEGWPNYGGFKSNENSGYYYSIDACRVIPALLKAYELIGDSDYLDAAVIAGKDFLKFMQDKQTHGGFARAMYNLVKKDGSWQVQASYDDICKYSDENRENWVFHPDRHDCMMGWDPVNGGALDEVFRFIGVNILPGVKIVSSKMKFYCVVPQVFDYKVKIDCEDVDDATQVQSLDDWASRVRTSSYVIWDDKGGAPDYFVWFYASVDFSSPLQEVINRPGWQSGNAINFFWETELDCEGLTPEPASYDSSYGSDKAPILEVEWVEYDWLLQMDVECLYGLIGLKMLCAFDPENSSQYTSMMEKAVDFLRSGLEDLYLHYDPSDSKWHRVGTSEDEVYDDPLAYALIGLYDYEGYSLSCQKVYEFLNSISASADYPGYNAYICWAGYIDVIKRKPACDYYDNVTMGILQTVRCFFDKPSLELSVKILNKYSDKLMFWGSLFTDYSEKENKQSIITVSWLSLLLLRYEPSHSRFLSMLRQHGVNVSLFPVIAAAETVTYGDPIDIKAFFKQTAANEIVIESGFILENFITVYTFIPTREHDKIRVKGKEYEVGPVQAFLFKGCPDHFRAVCRRLVGQ